MNLVAHVGRTVHCPRLVSNPDEIGWGRVALKPRRKSASTTDVRRRMTGELLADPALLRLSDQVLCRDARARFNVGRRTAESAVATARRQAKGLVAPYATGEVSAAPINHSVDTPAVSWEGAAA